MPRMFDFMRRGRSAEKRDLISISDPALVEFLGLGTPNDAGMTVGPVTAMGMTAVYRAVSLLSGTIAGLPAKSYATQGDLREQVPSFLDDPGAPDDLTSFEFYETVMVCLLLHGNAFLLHRYNNAGVLIGLYPVHPTAVSIDGPTPTRGKQFRVTMENGAVRVLNATQMTHIKALSHDGLRGLSPIQAARQSIGTGLAGDKTAARMFGSGLLIGGLVTTEEDIDELEANELKDQFRARTAGHDKAGDVAFVNRKLNFTPWNMNADDAQFIESRAFQVEEIARLYGLPSILLADSTKTTSWGAGVREVIQATHKFTFKPWTDRIQERLSRLLPDGQFVEFSYAGLLEGLHQDVVANMAAEIEAGILTPDEARRKLNRPPLGGTNGPA